MARNVVQSPWVHVKGADSTTRQIIHEAKSKMPQSLVSTLGVAYILAMPTGSGQRPSVVWEGHQGHKAFAKDMSAIVCFTVRTTNNQLHLF